MTRTFQLDDFGVDLTMQARTGRLDPVVGRQSEIERMIMILGRKGKNNPVLLGEPGVGKTAVVEGLAQWMVAGRVPNHLRSKTIYGLNLGQLLAGTSFRGDFEQRLQDLVKELRRTGANRLLFIDEIHLLGRAGRSEGGLDAANLLKPLLARGELPCIGASTAAEWGNMVAADPALERRFQPVEVGEPTAPETIEILKGLRPRYEAHHGVTITDGALAAAVAMAVERIPSRRLPDKAVDLLDEACARLRLLRETPATDRPELAEARQQLARAEARFDLDAVVRWRREFRQTPVCARPVLEAAEVGTHLLV
jgi:ATP-dependent Clp protease ATP-binding subunit ClpC